MKILVTGSSGLVGTALVNALAREGHTACRLVRRASASAVNKKVPPSGASSVPQGFDVAWNPATGELGGAAVGADAVVHLAGAPIAEGRWTAERKALLRSSRVETTRALVAALAKMNVRPRVLVSASAIGYYGNRGDEMLTEESKPGADFLAALGQDWEAEAIKAEVLGIRVVCARIGIVLAKHGGALSKMMLPFKFGVGGRLGSGQQWMSWVTLEDTVGILRLLLENAWVRGAVNVVAPQPVRNVEFTKKLAQALHRPALCPAPAFVLRLMLGEMADALLLSSQRVVPQQLEQIGYKFLHRDLSSALAAVLSPA